MFFLFFFLVLTDKCLNLTVPKDPLKDLTATEKHVLIHDTRSDFHSVPCQTTTEHPQTVRDVESDDNVADL